MRTHPLLVVPIMLSLSAGPAGAQPTPLESPRPATAERATTARPLVFALLPPPHGDPQNKNDPAYDTYREGYNLILNEQWRQAREMLGQVKKKFPKSEYVDDAEYWSAYAMRHIDREKALKEYQAFVEKYPKSRYHDDAMADLSDLSIETTVVTPPPGGHAPYAILPGRSSGESHSYVLAPNVKNLERQLRRMSRHFAGTATMRQVPFARFEDEKLDPQTRLKMDALYALGDTKEEDEKAFQTLKVVALNEKQPRQLREAAMDALSGFRKHDVLPIFVEIARKDTSEELQNYAVDFIGEHGNDKNQSVTVLIDLFNSIPRSRVDQRETIFYSIADIGNDKAVDFLLKVAITGDDYDLRRDAVYYLGNIGSDKARSALYEILKEQ
jgi:tetratricopeptide (TPR) repeat protein